MKPWTSWLACMGLAGSCLLWAGCGGGEESADPGADPGATAEGGNAEAAAMDPMAAQAAAQGGATPGAPAAAPEAAAPAAAEASPASAVPRGDASSGTAELLALANAPAPAAAAAPAEGQEGQAGGQGGGPVPGMPAGYGGAPGIPGGQGGAIPGQAGPAGFGGPPPGYPGASGGPGGYPGAPGAPGASGPPPGYPGAPGSGPPPGYGGGQGIPGGGYPGAPGGGIGVPGGPGGEGGRASFENPFTAVTAFLNAVQAKDIDRIAEATALRAPRESSPQYRKYFVAISELSLSSEELDELAKRFEGMQIQGANDAKSTGSRGVIIGKTDETGDQLSRTITVRKEKAGWKVLDISGLRTIDNPSQPVRRGR